MGISVWVSFGCSGFSHNPKICSNGELETLMCAFLQAAIDSSPEAMTDD